jgi:CRISPR-associated protein Cas5t
MAKEQYLVIEAYAEVASYRIPEYHNYHKTLPLPPPTTIIGIVGAALGLSPKMSQLWFDENNLEIGLNGTYQGIYSDLWKISSTKKTTESTIVKREYLYRNKYQFVFGCTTQIAKQIFEAFRYNKYALTAGNNDSLMVVKNTSYVSADMIKHVKSVENTFLIGDYRSKLSFNLEMLEVNKVYKYSTQISPVTHNVPYSFDYEEDETRTVRCRKELTFIGTRAELKEGITIPALLYKEIAIPIFSYNQNDVLG